MPAVTAGYYVRSVPVTHIETISTHCQSGLYAVDRELTANSQLALFSVRRLFRKERSGIDRFDWSDIMLSYSFSVGKIVALKTT